MSWRTEVLEPSEMTTADIGAELAHLLDAYDRLQHSTSRAAVVSRIEALVREMDQRRGAA